MILKPISEGRGVVGLVAYLTHDQVSADDPRPTTDERVAWTATLGGSPTADVDLCVRMMQGRAGPPRRHRQPHSGAPHRARRPHRPVRHLDPRSAKFPRTRRRRPRPLGTRERPPTGAAGRTEVGATRADPVVRPFSTRGADDSTAQQPGVTLTGAGSLGQQVRVRRCVQIQPDPTRLTEPSEAG